VTLLAVAAIGLAGCTAKKTESAGGTLPAAPDLMTASATAMKDVKTTHFAIVVEGTVGGVPLHKADGDLTRTGEAKGTATLDQFGATVEAEFVIAGGKLYLKGPTGGFQRVPAALASSVYDPSAILDAEKGVPKLLTVAAATAKTEARESVSGQDAYRVAVTPPAAGLSVLIPGVAEGVTGKIWIAADTKRVVKGAFTVPASGSDKGGTLTITLSNYDAPVTISAP
jgi:lipoprotein LprG